MGDIVFNQPLRRTEVTRDIEKLRKEGEKAQAYIDKYYSKGKNKVEYDEDGRVIAMESLPWVLINLSLYILIM